MMIEPMYSPWGTVDHCKMLCYGAFEVQTARHGGVMILRELADEYLSKEAQAVSLHRRVLRSEPQRLRSRASCNDLPFPKENT